VEFCGCGGSFSREVQGIRALVLMHGLSAGRSILREEHFAELSKDGDGIGIRSSDAGPMRVRAGDAGVKAEDGEQEQEEKQGGGGVLHVFVVMVCV